MLHVVGEYLADMNAGSKKPQNLVLFQFALEHVARISRIITSPGRIIAVPKRLHAECASICVMRMCTEQQIMRCKSQQHTQLSSSHVCPLTCAHVHIDIVCRW